MWWDTTERSTMGENKLTREELELISSCILEQLDIANKIPTLMDRKLFEAKEDLRSRLAALNSKICAMMPED